MTEKKISKIEFAPGAFDSFEGTQEELDALMAEITSMFENKTPEEILSMSQTVDIDDLIDEDPDVAFAVLKALNDEDGQGRKLQ